MTGGLHEKGNHPKIEQPQKCKNTLKTAPNRTAKTAKETRIMSKSRPNFTFLGDGQI